MKKNIISNILTAISGVLYVYLFWHEGMGLSSLFTAPFASMDRLGKNIAHLFRWDLVITRYNISAIPAERIDLYFLNIVLSDKNLYLLESRKEELAKEIERQPEWVEKGLSEKRSRFKFRIGRQSWKSWNVPDWRNKRYFRKH